MTVLYIIIGLAVGVASAWILASRKTVQSAIELEKKNTELAMRAEQLQQVTKRLTEVERENKTLMGRAESQAREIEILRRQSEEEARMRSEQFAEQLRTAKEQITNMANQIMEQNARRLKEQNSENIGHITQPLRDAISDMRKAITDNIKDSAQNSASFREQIRMMIESNREIGEKAESLANVLRRDNKAAGNMGEIILGDLLASQGLTEGIHYEVQARLRDETGRALKNDETGREMQPDVILHYPQGQDAIIDSKVSLSAFIDYQNAGDDEAARADALNRHVQSLRNHYKELARKDYKSYIKPPKQTLNYVIMFVPNESALQLALVNDTALWREAYSKGVFITGEQNLLAVLRLIDMAWVQQEQTKNQEEILKQARLFLDRVGDFVRHFDDIAVKLDAARQSFNSAKEKMLTGRLNIMAPARKLADMSGQENPKKPIPGIDA